ncbi:hypothetical protein TNCV_1799961 [Trichonephila clavipes]|nr:hypothetical protein TNCV_1799961 [Trichonephila clavipes]
MIVQFRNEKVSNHGSIPITIDCKVVAFIVFEEGFHQPIKRTKQEGAAFFQFLSEVPKLLEPALMSSIFLSHRGFRSWCKRIQKPRPNGDRRVAEFVKMPGCQESDLKKKNEFCFDEAHFWLNGYVNKQNCCIWSEANPQVYVETPLHPEKLTVWCALWAGGILLQKR